MKTTAEAKYESFRDIALEIARVPSLIEIFGVIQSHLQKLIPHDHASIVLVSPDGDKLNVPVATDLHTGKPVYLHQQWLSSEETILGKVVASGKLLYRPDIKRSKPLYAACRKLLAKGLVSDLLIPLNAGGKVIGTLNLASRRSNPYTSEEIENASDVALLVALGIERCRLISELLESKREIEKYNLDLEKILEERTSELINAQNRMIQTEKLASIGRLGASLGHELRNPLAVIKNIAYFLRLKLASRDAKVKRQIDILEREVRIAERIIQNLLNFSKSQPPSRIPADLKQIALEAVEEARLPEEISVEVSAPPDLPQVPVDRIEILQVFMNLIQNSVRAMPEGGKLRISLAIEAVPAAAREWVAIRVRDTGTGIREEDIEKIFEPLFTTHHSGIGLGLSLVRLILERHEGEVSVESKVGRGATFTLRLPVSI